MPGSSWWSPRPAPARTRPRALTGRCARSRRRRSARIARFLFASNKATLNADFNRILKDLQGGLGGPVNNSNHGIVHDLHNLFAISIANLYVAGAAIAC